jgi:hypothetical protein
MKTVQISLTICENLPDFSVSDGLVPYLWRSPAPKFGLFNLKSTKCQSTKSTVCCPNRETVYLLQCLGQIHITKQNVTTQQWLVTSSNSSADFIQGSPWKVSNVHFKFCLFSPMFNFIYLHCAMLWQKEKTKVHTFYPQLCLLKLGNEEHFISTSSCILSPRYVPVLWLTRIGPTQATA